MHGLDLGHPPMNDQDTIHTHTHTLNLETTVKIDNAAPHMRGVYYITHTLTHKHTVTAP